VQCTRSRRNRLLASPRSSFSSNSRGDDDDGDGGAASSSPTSTLCFRTRHSGGGTGRLHGLLASVVRGGQGTAASWLNKVNLHLPVLGHISSSCWCATMVVQCATLSSTLTLTKFDEGFVLYTWHGYEQCSSVCLVFLVGWTQNRWLFVHAESRNNVFILCTYASFHHHVRI
jgi:hypothetical protein